MDDWHSKATKMHASRCSFKYISEHLGVPIDEVKTFIHEGKEKTVVESKKAEKEKHVVFENMTPVVHKKPVPKNKIITFGLIGDLHSSSKYVQYTYLHQFYDICHERGIPDVFMTGDIDEGEQMRVGHTYECYRQGGDDHIDEIVQHYPKRDGMVTHFITGNHDASIYKRCGIDIGKTIANKRPDMDYLGRDCARIEFAPHCILELRHPC